MTVRLPTASGLDRAMLCPGSAVLDRVPELADRLQEGSLRHRFLQRCNEVGQPVALAEIEDDSQRMVCAAIDLEGLPLDPAAYAPEVTFAWSHVTGEARELGRSLVRDYSAAADDEFVGTADVVALVGDDGVFVADWKSYWDPVPPAKRNRQLRFLALAAARAYGRDRAVVEIIRPSTEGAWRDRAELDMFELLDVAEEMRELARGVDRSAAGEPELVVGAHCRRCQSRRYCRAQQAMLVALVAQDPKVLREKFVAGLNDETAPLAHAKLEALTALLDLLWEELQGYALEHPFRLDDEHVYGPVQMRRESIVGSVAWRVVEQLYGVDEAWKVAEVKVTKAALERLEKARLKGTRGVTKAVAQLLAKIDAAGGLKAKVGDEVRKHRG